MILHGEDDGHEIGDVVRSFLDQHVETRDAPLGARIDRDLWTRACRELGIAAVDLPEELDGLGAGFGTLAAVVQEGGRVLARLPLLGSVVVAQYLVAASGDRTAQAKHLPGLLDGSAIAAVALDPEAATLTRDTGFLRLSGRLEHVMDGASADLLLTVVETDEGISVVACRTDADGVTRTVQHSMDLTRDFAAIDLEDVEVTPVGEIGGMGEALQGARLRLAAAVACEQLAGAEHALEDAVAYARTRIQFGREIASFQAIKHRCADLATDVDSLRSAVDHAVWAVATSAPDADNAVAIAAATGCRVHLRCALENVQIHGGIGFTWEHSAHLYVRRAESHLALHGDEATHLERVVQTLGI